MHIVVYNLTLYGAISEMRQHPKLRPSTAPKSVAFGGLPVVASVFIYLKHP